MQHLDELFNLVEKGNVSNLESFFNEHTDISVDLKNKEQKTPLMLSVLTGNKEVVTFLLNKKKANPNIDDGEPNYETALHYAAEEKNTSIVDEIIASELANKELLNRALIYYAEIGNEDKVKICLEKGADINATHLGNTALMEAIIGGHENIALLLIDHPDISINLFNNMHEHALLLSLISKMEKLTTKLLQRDDVDLHLQGYLASTSLTYAIFSGQEKFAEDLINKEIKKYGNLHNDSHPEALNCAIKKNSFNIVKLLIENGFDSNQSGDFKHIVRPDWVWKTIFEVDYPISESESERNDLPLICAVKSENAEAVEYLINAGADFKKENSNHETAFGVSSEMNLQNLLKLMDNSDKNLDKPTPLSALGFFSAEKTSEKESFMAEKLEQGMKEFFSTLEALGEKQQLNYVQNFLIKLEDKVKTLSARQQENR